MIHGQYYPLSKIFRSQEKRFPVEKSFDHLIIFDLEVKVKVMKVRSSENLSTKLFYITIYFC